MNPAGVLTTTLGLRPRAEIYETLATGLAPLDAVTGGFPRGAISEIAGPESSGRTTLLYALLAASTGKLEICAYVDAADAFDPVTAAAAGVALGRMVWIRSGKNAEHAFQAADALLHAGGFGVVALDLCRISAAAANRIPVSYWYRFRRAVENTPAILAVAAKQPLAKACASFRLEMRRAKTVWAGAPGFEMARESEIEAIPRKPARSAVAKLTAAFPNGARA